MKKKKSKVKGVYFNKCAKQWHVYIWEPMVGKKIHWGYYKELSVAEEVAKIAGD